VSAIFREKLWKVPEECSVFTQRDTQSAEETRQKRTPYAGASNAIQPAAA
jgi:hypothetical protein